MTLTTLTSVDVFCCSGALLLPPSSNECLQSNTSKLFCEVRGHASGDFFALNQLGLCLKHTSNEPNLCH